MGKETPLASRADATRVRKAIGTCGEEALAQLAVELKRYRGRQLPEAWTRKFKAIADQLRRDYRLDVEDEAADAAPAAVPADPLDGIKLLRISEAG